MYKASLILVSEFLGAFAKLRRAAVNFVLSGLSLPTICPSVNSPNTGWIFMKIYIWIFFFQKDSDFTKIWREYRVLYMKTNIHFWSYLAQFFLEWEMFQTKVVQKIRTHISDWITFFFRKSCCLWDNVEKYCRAGQATDDSIAHAHCMLDTKGYKHTLRICNNYCFPTAILVTFIRTLRVLLSFKLIQ